MTDERPESLASQAASWVPPWERAARQPDRSYQAAAAEPDISDDLASAEDDLAPEEARLASDEVDGPSAALDQPDSVDQPDEGEKIDEAGLTGDDDDDDFDESFEGPNPPGYSEEEPPEIAVLPGEADAPATVDAPQELPGEESPEPTDVHGGSELPMPATVEEASEENADSGSAVDGTVPAGGDDAGEVFDLAADDNVSDDDEVDLPFVEVVPSEDDDAAALAADDAPFIQSGDGTASLDGETPDVPGDGEAAALGGDAAASLASASAGDGGTAARGGGGKAPLGGDERASAEVGAGTGRARSRSGIPVQGRWGAESGAAVGGTDARTEEIDRAMDDAELRAALEAILLVVDEPVAEMQLAQILEQPTERVAAMLEDISARYTAAGHGFDLRRAAGGWRLYTRPEYAPYVERFVLDGQSVRLTQAALETLAVVAYKQPVTRSRISAIRGVNCDGVMRTLVTRGLIEECGTESETGAFLYRTTSLFLEKLGLNSVDQLPPLAPFLPDDVEEVLDASG